MSTSTIDPRIRARRIAVRRDEGRKRLRRLGVLGGVTAVLAGAWGLSLSPVLDVDHVRVRGASRSGAATVAVATGISRGDALLTVDLGRAAKRAAALPWVQTVRVERHWPGTVRVSVVERTATAAVPSKGGGWVLLDAEARQLEAVPEPPAGVLRIAVPAVEPAIGRSLRHGADPGLELAATVPERLRDRLLSLRPGPGGTVQGTVRLDGDAEATVLFGTPAQADAKWVALASVLAGADLSGVGTIDVRVPAVPALTRR